jgi:hypothetical protein
VLLALLYLFVRRVFRLAGGPSNDLHNDIEIVVVRPRGAQAPGGQAPPASPRPAVHGGPEQGAPSPALVILPCQPADAPSLAS